MTDNEIKKALECCTTNGASCKDCPAFVKVDRSNCKKYFRGALDLINRLEAEIDDLKRDDLPRCKDALRRANENGIALEKENQELKAEIEELNKNYGTAIEYFSNSIRNSRAETVKEFAEKAKEELDEWIGADNSITYSRIGRVLDNLAKEMVGE